MKRVYVAVSNDLSTDQRVHKMCVYLADKGLEVHLVGRKLPESLPLNRPYACHRMPLFNRRGWMFYAELQLRLFLFLLLRKRGLYLANDLDTLPAMALISRLKNADLVYDAHEYFLGVPEIQHKPTVKKIWASLERVFLPWAKARITVNDSIAALFQSTYSKPFEVVRNIPPRKEFPPLLPRKALGLPQTGPIVLMQGAGINVNRGAEEALEAMQWVSPRAYLVFVGDGDVVGELKEQAKQLQLNHRVIFIPKVPFEQLASYTRLASIGLSLDKPNNLNYQNSLPNKLFDYIHAGVPVLVSEIYEVAKVVRNYGIGEVLENHDPQKMAQALNQMLEVLEVQNPYEKGLERAREELTWQKECEVLDRVYEPLIKSGSQ